MERVPKDAFPAAPETRATGIPGAAHLPPADDPAATATVIADFISEIERTADDTA